MGNGVNPGDNDCKNLWGCFKFVLCYGVRQGGGVGEVLKLSIGPRFLIDSTYFIVLIVMMLNIIFGIIIDTFSSLRANKNIRSEDTNTVCFICGINDQVFDRASSEPDGFKNHIKLDHNMWNYLYFIFMLWEQDKDDDDGLEQYVRRAIDAKEITWFPIRKAMRLEQVDSPADLLRGDLKESIKTTKAHLTDKFDEFQGDVNVMFEQLMQSLRNDQVQAKTPAVWTPGEMQSASVDLDDSVGSFRAVVDSSYMKDLSPGKHVSVAMVSVEGVKLSEAELGSVHCRVIYESGMDDYRNIGLDRGIVRFDEHKSLPLFDNVIATDRRMFQVQILYGAGVMKFIAVIEMSVLELLNDTQSVFLLEKIFTRPEQPEQQCSLKMTVTTEVAKKFGRHHLDGTESPSDSVY
jgi:hypothetical protein